MTKQKIKMIEIKVKGMTCSHCEEKVSAALRNTPGILKVCHVDWKSGNTCVEADENFVTSQIGAAIERAGYKTDLLSSSPITGSATSKARLQSLSKDEFDLLIVGAGSAGFAATIKASELGAKVGLVEGSTMGGTCVNVGCVPSKTLIRAAEIQHRAENHHFKGIKTSANKPSWFEVRNQKDDLILQLRKAKYADVLKSYDGIEYIEGRARVLSSSLGVELSSGRQIKASKVLITTGAKPWAAPIPGLSETRFLDSTSAMNLESLPASMIVLGGAAVGLELAQTFFRLGVKITVIEAAPHIAPLEDAEIATSLARYLEEEGMRVLSGHKILGVRQSDRGHFQVLIKNNSQEFTLEAEQLLVATGRRPNTESLGLKEASIALGPKGHILTNEYLQTNNPNVYAAGDCTTEAAFVYVSAYGGNLAAENALTGNKKRFDISVLPKVTFTDPQVASVGLTEAQAREKGIDVVSASVPLEHVPRAIAARDIRGFIKLVAEKSTMKLLGAHILAPDGGELIEIPTIAMKFGITINDLATTFFPYLTQSEAIKLCALMFTKDVNKLSCCAV